MKKSIFILLLLLSMMIVGCANQNEPKVQDVNNEKLRQEETNMVAEATYNKISQEEAMKIMENESDFIILDVRTEEEYAEGHIEGAINLPLDKLPSLASEKLPNPDKKLLVYCRSGNRSSKASQDLAEAGYTNIFEFGGIMTWKGKIVVD